MRVRVGMCFACMCASVRARAHLCVCSYVGVVLVCMRICVNCPYNSVGTLSSNFDCVPSSL